MYCYFTNLHDYIESSAEKFPDKVALVATKKSFTYHDIKKYSKQLASFMIANGLQRQDRVVVCLDNSFESVVGFWATLMAGGVISVVNPDVGIDKLKYILEDLDAVTLICGEKHFARLNSYLLASKKICRILLQSDASIYIDAKVMSLSHLAYQ